jgi:hypothetical protein
MTGLLVFALRAAAKKHKKHKIFFAGAVAPL